MGRQIHTNSDPSITDESFDEAAVIAEEDDAQQARDLATEEYFDTQHSDGHTYNVDQALEQGLVWTPPDDEPVVPSGLQNVEMAAGFSQSMEASDPDDEILPESIDDNDLELQNSVYRALRYNSETTTLDNVTVRARDGVVTLLGTVPSDDDIGLVYSVASDLPNVGDVVNRLTVEG